MISLLPMNAQNIDPFKFLIENQELLKELDVRQSYGATTDAKSMPPNAKNPSTQNQRDILEISEVDRNSINKENSEEIKRLSALANYYKILTNFEFL